MQVVVEVLGIILFGTGFAAFLLVPPTWLLLSILTPKKLLDQYFKVPHFTLAETILMAEFPGFLMRTSVFGWLLLLPKLGKNRER